MLGGVEGHARVGHLGRGQRPGRLGREEQPQAGGVRRGGQRVLLGAVLGHDPGQVDLVVRADGVEQGGGDLVRGRLARRPPTVVGRGEPPGHEGRAGEDRVAEPEVLAARDTHALPEQRRVDGGGVRPDPARVLLLEADDVRAELGPGEPTHLHGPVGPEHRHVHVVPHDSDGDVHPATVVRPTDRRRGPERDRPWAGSAAGPADP